MLPRVGVACLLLTAAGCYLSHERETDAPPPGVDAGTRLDAGSPFGFDAGARDAGPPFVPVCPKDVVAEANRIDELSSRIGFFGGAPGDFVRGQLLSVTDTEMMILPEDASLPPFAFGWAASPLTSRFAMGQTVEASRSGDWEMVRSGDVTFYVQRGMGAGRVIPPSDDLIFSLRDICEYDGRCGDASLSGTAFALDAAHRWTERRFLLNAGEQGDLGSIEMFVVFYEGAVEVHTEGGVMCVEPGFRSVVMLESTEVCIC